MMMMTRLTEREAVLHRTPLIYARRRIHHAASLPARVRRASGHGSCLFFSSFYSVLNRVQRCRHLGKVSASRRLPLGWIFVNVERSPRSSSTPDKSGVTSCATLGGHSFRNVANYPARWQPVISDISELLADARLSN